MNLNIIKILWMVKFNWLPHRKCGKCPAKQGKNNNRKANRALKSSAFPTYTNTMIKLDESLSTHKYNSMRARMCGIAPVITTTKAMLYM